MKKSLRFLIGAILTVALVSGGAVIGTLLPAKTMFFATITIVAIAAMALILIGYNGHKKDDDEE